MEGTAGQTGDPFTSFLVIVVQCGFYLSAIAVVVVFPLSVFVRVRLHRRRGEPVVWKNIIEKSFGIPLILFGIGALLIAFFFLMVTLFGRAAGDVPEDPRDHDYSLQLDSDHGGTASDPTN